MDIMETAEPDEPRHGSNGSCRLGYKREITSLTFIRYSLRMLSST